LGDILKNISEVDVIINSPDLENSPSLFKLMQDISRKITLIQTTMSDVKYTLRQCGESKQLDLIVAKKIEERLLNKTKDVNSASLKSCK
jgi:S-ribosylhomocysteine lyase LuxS involved in autoinducer biosynthesis